MKVPFYLESHMGDIFFIHSLIDGSLGCFCILAIVSNFAAT